MFKIYCATNTADVWQDILNIFLANQLGEEGIEVLKASLETIGKADILGSFRLVLIVLCSTRPQLLLLWFDKSTSLHMPELIQDIV